MARARNIKPGFYKNEDLAECAIWARFIFPGLWQQANRAGRLEDRPKRLKAELLPFDDKAPPMDRLLQELHDRRFILRYEVEGRPLIQVLKFKKHQNPHHAERETILPEPPADLLQSLGFVLTDDGYEPGVPDLFNTMLAPGLPRSSRAESLDLNPDSLNRKPDTTGLAPGSGQSGKNGNHSLQELRRQAVEILNFLNEKAGKHYHPVKQNIDLIVSLLKQGASMDDLRGVIARKCREWKDKPDVDQYLRPATLFGPKNFWAKYHGELGAPHGSTQ